MKVIHRTPVMTWTRRKSRIKYFDTEYGVVADILEYPADFESAGRGYTQAEIDLAAGTAMTIDQLEHFVVGYLSALRDAHP